jgi:DNA-binding NarL/FixJ family response regulator
LPVIERGSLSLVQAASGKAILLESSAPKTSGLALARWFKARFPQTRILLTTTSLWELLSQIGDHEPFGIRVKPFGADELKRMVRGLAASV